LKRAALFLFILSTAIYAQEESLDIKVVTHPEIIEVGQNWTLTLFVDYPDPDDVSVLLPDNEALFLERILKTPTFTEDHVQTVIEYRFTPVKSGRFILREITVECPQGIAQTEPFILDISANTEEKKTQSFQLNWEIESPRSIRQGERVILTLRGWNSQLPPPEFFLPSALPGLILAPSPFSAQERKNGIATKMIIIPLETGDIFFPARILQYENITINIPAFQIKVIHQNTSIKNSDDSAVQLNDSENNINFIENVDSSPDFSDVSINKRILQRRFLFGFSILIIILVIITPLVCLFLFVRKK
jgi:hypothetical protein